MYQLIEINSKKLIIKGLQTDLKKLKYEK